MDKVSVMIGSDMMWMPDELALTIRAGKWVHSIMGKRDLVNGQPFLMIELDKKGFMELLKNTLYYMEIEDEQREGDAAMT